ncbi:MAG: PEGA domain-containing protein [Planctomycetota bacterium]|nr:PEGA domain-containing protein [Planctomycetota bacterium]
MKYEARHITTALVMALALTVGACGDTSKSGDQSSSTGSAASTTAANITFRTDPTDVEVWLDGKNAGTTPVVIAIEAGTHDIEFKREGFTSVKKDGVEIQAGKDLTVSTALAVSGEPEARVKTLLAALGIPEHENIAPKAHRGSTPPVMLYWPKKTVRKEGLTTWRIELVEYDDDGFLVFRKGKKELYRQPFKAESEVMEGALPTAVIEALKRGTTITWGIDFESKRQKDVMAKFTVSDGKALAKKLKRLEKRQVYRRAGALDRRMAQIELKRNYRYYTEALTDSMSVLNTWPTTQMADKVIADSLQRLKLKDSLLYTEIMKRVRGRGPNKGGNSGNGGLGTVTRPLPPSLVAPKFKQPAAGKADQGAMGPGGVGIKPTPGAGTDAPGTTPDVGGSNDSGVTVDPAKTREQDEQARRAEVGVLETTLAEQEKITAELEEAQQRMQDANQAVKDAMAKVKAATQAVDDAQQGVRDAQATGDPTKIAAAQKELEKATQRAEGLADAVKAAEQAKSETANQSRALMEQHGTADDAKAREEELKQKIEQAKQPKEHEQYAEGMPRPDRVDEDPLAEPTEKDFGQEAEAVVRSGLETEIANAKEQLENASQWIDNSSKAVDLAKTAYEAASKEMDDAEASGDTARIDAAELALGRAHEQLSRSAMELERATATKGRAGNELERAKANLDKWDQEAGQREADKNDPAKR